MRRGRRFAAGTLQVLRQKTRAMEKGKNSGRMNARAHEHTHTGGCTTTNSSERVKGVEFFVRLHSNAERLALSKPAEEKK